ncbi:MAG: insulinase family protein [Clostridia bacterium]|nr:insulinase family protein [Clostridia bacterium]
MITKAIQITEGVRLNYIEVDKFKTNYFSFNFISELSTETVSLNSLIPLILMRGCQKYPNQAAINKRLQYLYSGEIGGRNTKFGEYQIFGLRANMLDNRFCMGTDVTKDTIELVCDMIFAPLLINNQFNEDYVKGEKISLIDALESERNNKTQYAIKRTTEEMCKNEVFSISKYGTAEQINKITSKELYDAYLNMLSTYQIEIFFVGKCDIEAIEQQIKARFKDIPRKVKPLLTAKTVEKAKEVKEVTDIENVKQGKLCLGFRTGYRVEDKQYHFLQLFNEIFGGSPTSKLFMNVREKMSLCYFCRSIINQRNGIMIVASGIEFENKEIAKNAIIAQLDAIKNAEISKEEFESAKKSIKNGYMQVYDGAESMEAWAFFRGLCGTKATPYDECVKIDSTTITDIQNVANKITLDTVYFLKGKDAEVENG